MDPGGKSFEREERLVERLSFYSWFLLIEGFRWRRENVVWLPSRIILIIIREESEYFFFFFIISNEILDTLEF